jgi:hypothetical protein
MLEFKPRSIELLQQLSDAEKIKRKTSCEDDTSGDYIVFSVEAPSVFLDN